LVSELLLAEARCPDSPLFRSRNGTPLDAHNINNRVFRPLSKRLGFPVTWHAFRRAHSSCMAEIDAPIADRILMMGHAEMQMTLSYDVQSLEQSYDVQSLERRRKYVGQIVERLDFVGKKEPWNVQ
jgi:integrase